MIRPQYQLSLRRSKMIIAGGKICSKNYQIEEEKCNGCGACADACHEGAIGMVNGKAKLLRDDYCDGLGDCLPACPTGAITFVEREAAAYDEAAVLQNKKREQTHHAGCPGHQMHQFNRDQGLSAEPISAAGVSQLRQWPVPDQAGSSQRPLF